MASATSSGSAMRPRGEAAPTTTSSSGLTPILPHIGVRTAPGCTELTRMASVAHSSATALVNRRTPPLLAQYALERGDPVRPAAEDTLTIEPPSPCCLMARTPCLVPRKTPSRLTAISARQSASVVSVTARTYEMPALLTSTSSRPWVSNTVAMTRSQLDSSVTSCSAKMAPAMEAATCWPVGSTSVTTTRKRGLASRVAVARPIPDAPPVTSAAAPCTLRSSQTAGLGTGIRGVRDVVGTPLLRLKLPELSAVVDDRGRSVAVLEAPEVSGEAREVAAGGAVMVLGLGLQRAGLAHRQAGPEEFLMVGHGECSPVTRRHLSRQWCGRRLVRRGEGPALAPAGDEHRPGSGLGEAASEAADVAVDGALADLLAAPDAPGQLVLAEHAGRVAGELGEQLELQAADMHRDAHDGDGLRGEVDSDR